MLFNSQIFLFVFLPFTLAGWYYLNYKKHDRLAQGYLTGMSLWFYAYLNLQFLWTMLVSCLAGYVFCRLVLQTTSEKKRKAVFYAGCLFHLGALGYFKYTGFFLENINAVFHTQLPMLRILLPVGISFYTFQQLSYLIDCYKGKAGLCSFLDYLFFIVYFPQILQGPILVHEELIPQLHEKERRRFDPDRFYAGISRFVIGLSKKALLADTLAKAVGFGYDQVERLDSASALFLAVGYLLELYFDFSGYCDMAVGLGKMVGIEIPENFDAPFRSLSVREFWRRWHITLGRFFTKYVYIPLGGSRKGKLRTICNTMIVFLLSGLWHGADWTFVFWGFLHGIGVAASDLTSSFKESVRKVLTFSYVCLAFVFFRASSISEGFLVIGKIFSFRWNGFLLEIAKALDLSEIYVVTKALSMKAPGVLSILSLFLLLLFVSLCLIFLIGPGIRPKKGTAGKKKGHAVLLAVLFVWSVLSLTGVSTFLYFDF